MNAAPTAAASSTASAAPAPAAPTTAAPTTAAPTTAASSTAASSTAASSTAASSTAASSTVCAAVPGRAAAAGTLWHDGWYAWARHLASPNFGPRPAGMLPELVVVHAISLPPGRYGSGAVDAFFTNRLDWDADPYFRTLRGLQVSAHFVIERTGRLTQYVSCDARAWHAGRSSWRGRGDCNDWSVGIELEGLEGDLFEDAQYDTLAAVLGALVERYPIRMIAGHEHVAPGRKHDPGPGFDWLRLRRMTGWRAAAYPPA